MPWWQQLTPPSSIKGKSRAKKLRQLSGNEAKRRCEQSPSRPRTTNSSSAAQPQPQVSPQPLPLPQLRLLLGREDKPLQTNPGNVPKPSLQDLIYQLEKEKPRERGLDSDVNGVNGLGKLATRDGLWSTEYHETRSARRSSQPQSIAEKSLENNGLYGPRSAPATPYSSPNRNYPDIFTPQHMTPPAWKSAPEAPPADTTPCNHSPSGTISQLQKKVPSESSLLKGDGAPRTGVHSLPRPPGGMTLQPPPVPPLPLTPEITPVNSRWRKGKLIGRGTFGSVYVASNRQTGALCAMKEVEILHDDNKSSECIRQLEQEIKVLSNLKHPNIVQYYGSEIVGDRFYIYLEYVHPGSITKFIKDHYGAMTECVVRSFTRHILYGLAYLHSTKTIHRDIKGANLLVDASGVVKLADFGMAKHLNGHNANLSLKGSPYWMAPELLQSVMHHDATADIALAVDIWSLGCTIIEMLTGRPPWSEYEGPAAMFKVLKENPPIPDDLSDEGRDFLNCCFKRNPAERPSASMLLEHQFVKDSHQLDVPSTSLIELTETVQSQKDNPINKMDLAPSDDTKGRQFDNESGQQCHQDAFNPKAVYHHSPRSTLDALPGLSPPHSRH